MFTYILKSTSWPLWRYVGATQNLERRFKSHKRGSCSSTCKYKEEIYISRSIPCNSKKEAFRLERYLKRNYDKFHMSDRDLLIRSSQYPYTEWELNLKD